MEKMGMVSIIIPAYNAESTLRRACMSVLEQSYADLQLIVVNDGSTDGTETLLRELCLEHPNLVAVHQRNGGVSKARNTGLDAAEGEYIMFLDADDELLPGIVEDLVRMMCAFSCDVIACPCERVRPDGSSFFTTFPLRADPQVWKGMEGFENSLRDHPATYSVWAKLYRAEILDGVRFVEGRRLHEDGFFLFELLQKEPTMVLTQKPAVRYHMGADSASRGSFSDKYLDILYFTDRKYKTVDENYPQFLSLAKNVRIKGSISFLNNLWKAERGTYRAEERFCQQTIRQNAAFFIPVGKVDRVVFYAVKFHLFWLYKLLYRLMRKYKEIRYSGRSKK